VLNTVIPRSTHACATCDPINPTAPAGDSFTVVPLLLHSCHTHISTQLLHCCCSDNVVTLLSQRLCIGHEYSLFSLVYL
jgi:hypothetical protein